MGWLMVGEADLTVDRLLNLNQVAAILAVTYDKAWTLCSTGQIASVNVSCGKSRKTYRVRLSAVQAYIASHESGVNPIIPPKRPTSLPPYIRRRAG